MGKIYAPMTTQDTRDMRVMFEVMYQIDGDHVTTCMGAWFMCVRRSARTRDQFSSDDAAGFITSVISIRIASGMK